MDNYMNIAIICDDNCIDGACVVVRSFLEKNKTGCHIYTMLDLFSDASKRKLEIAANVGSSNNTITNLIVPQRVLNIVDRFGPINQFPPMVFYRLFLPWMVDGIDRILYLDSDLLIRQPISAFYQSEFEGKLCACVPDIQGAKFGAAIGTSDYVNSGVILFNLRGIKENYTLETYLNLFSVKSASVQLQYPDQDVLNLMFDRQMLLCDERYNNHSAFWKINVLKKAKQLYTSSIIHFTGRPKPWEAEYMFPFSFEYFSYLRFYRSGIEKVRYWVRKPVCIFKYVIAYLKARKIISR